MPKPDSLQEFFAPENPVPSHPEKTTPQSQPTPPITLVDYFHYPKQANDDPWQDFAQHITTKTNRMLDENRAWLPYLEKMQPYQYPSTRRDVLFWKHKHDIIDPNIGWKCHLNIAPEDVCQVSSVLKKLDLEHKYLFADVLDGKIFTVYLGSKRTVETVMPLLYENLKSYLLEPKAPGEILLAPRIVGRFSGSKVLFATKISFRGITLLSEDIPTISNQPQALAAWRRADQKLRDQYGDYYGGLIRPC